MLSRPIWLFGLAALGVRAQDETGTGTNVATTATATGDDDSSSTPSGTSSETGSDYQAFTFTNSDLSTISTTIPVSDFSGSEYTYVTRSGQQTVTTTAPKIYVSGDRTLTLNSENGTASATSDSQITRTTNTDELTRIGGNRTMTATGTTSAPAASNTAPCNNYPEFCDRKYSNITEVCAHNAAFSVPRNAASNQELPILDQLNDGVRMLQGQVHYINETLYNCHTSCDLLNAGTFQSELETIVGWLRENPFEVLTMLIGNSDLAYVEDFVPAIQNSGIAPYLYTPPLVPMHKDDWPTLGEMILNNDRVVMFMDYYANQDSVPYILEEFTHIWETPFSPQDPEFPCTIERPPGLDPEEARKNFMYIANHNLNVAVELGALTGGDGAILLPNTAQINNTNGKFETTGQLGAMALNCSNDHGAPPNFLLVDYYNRGDPAPGSVFEVAARWNNVTYNRPCCGAEARNPASVMRVSAVAPGAAVLFAVGIAW